MDDEVTDIDIRQYALAAAIDHFRGQALSAGDLIIAARLLERYILGPDYWPF